MVGSAVPWPAILPQSNGKFLLKPSSSLLLSMYYKLPKTSGGLSHILYSGFYFNNSFEIFFEFYLF